jgi:hypothetical protein
VGPAATARQPDQAGSARVLAPSWLSAAIAYVPSDPQGECAGDLLGQVQIRADQPPDPILQIPVTDHALIVPMPT